MRSLEHVPKEEYWEETACPSASEDGPVISQILCPFIGSFDMTLWLYLSIILNPYTVKMLIREGKAIT